MGGESTRRPLLSPSSPGLAQILFFPRKERRQRRERPGGASVWSRFGVLTEEGSPAIPEWTRPRKGAQTVSNSLSPTSARAGAGRGSGTARWRTGAPRWGLVPPRGCRRNEAAAWDTAGPGLLRGAATPLPAGGGSQDSDSCQARGRCFASPPPPRLPQAGPRSRRHRRAYPCCRRAARPRCPRCPHQR